MTTSSRRPLGVAIAGFGWLAYQIEKAYVSKEDAAPAVV